MRLIHLCWTFGPIILEELEYLEGHSLHSLPLPACDMYILYSTLATSRRGVLSLFYMYIDWPLGSDRLARSAGTESFIGIGSRLRLAFRRRTTWRLACFHVRQRQLVHNCVVDRRSITFPLLPFCLSCHKDNNSRPKSLGPRVSEYRVDSLSMKFMDLEYFRLPYS